MNSGNKITRDICRGTMYSRGVTNLELGTDESCILLVASENILNIWRDYVRQLLNVHGVNNVRQKCLQLSH